MKIKKILLTASLAALATATLASCSGKTTKRNTVTPYGTLNLDETFATANGDLKMTVGQYYTQLRKNGYNVVTNAINKKIYAAEIEAMQGVYDNKTRTDFINNLSKEKLAILECVDSGDDSKTEQGKLFDLTSDTAEANDKYKEIRKKLVKNVHSSIAGAIYGTTSAKDYKKLKEKDINTSISKYIDTVAGEGIFISASDIEDPILPDDTTLPDDTKYFTKVDDLIQIPDNTLNKLSQKVSDVIQTQARYLAGKKELFKIADEEYVYDEETKDDIKNTNYLFTEKTIKDRYESKYKKYGTYNAIVIQFNSRKEAMDAVEGYSFIDVKKQESESDKETAISSNTAQYINLYNDYYKYRKQITEQDLHDNDDFNLVINEDKNDLSDLPSGIQTLITDTLEDGECTITPRDIDNKYVMVFKLGTTYTYNTGDETEQAETLDDLSDERKAETEAKIKDDIITENTSYAAQVDHKRYEDAKIEIYDPYFENSFYNAYSDEYEFTTTKVTSSTEDIFKIGDYTYKVSDFFEDATKKYSASILTNYFELEFAKSYYDTFVDMYLIDDELQSDNEDTLNDEISKFKKNKNTTYGKEVGMETFLLAQYGYTTKEDVLEYYYKASKALSTYKNILVYDSWRSTEADGDGNYSVADLAREGFLKNILKTGNAEYSDLFAINLDHILINIDDDGDGNPDDPDDFLAGKTDTEIQNFEAAVVELARAIYTESIYISDNKSSIFDTLKYIKSQYELGENLNSDPSKSWDDYKKYNFLLTAEQLAASSDIDQDSVSNYVEPFKEYVEGLYQSVSHLTNDTYKEVDTSDSSKYNYEYGKYYYVDTTTIEDYKKDIIEKEEISGGFIESASNITADTLCKTSFGYHMLLINSYSLPGDLSYTESEASEYQKNIELILRTYIDSDDEEQTIKLYISSLNEPASGEDKCTTASFEQFFIYYVQKANGTSTSLTSSIYSLMSSLFDEAISTYSGSSFQEYLLLNELNIQIVKTSNSSRQEIVTSYVNKLKNSIISYDENSEYNEWFTLTWTRPEIKK